MSHMDEQIRGLLSRAEREGDPVLIDLCERALADPAAAQRYALGHAAVDVDWDADINDARDRLIPYLVALNDEPE